MEKPDLDGSTAFITGTTRGIGKSIALALAEQGCNIVSTGKTVDDTDTDLEGTIHKTAEACREKGVEAHAIELDVRDEENVHSAVDESIEEFGEVDIVINNASAIQIANVEELPANRFDLLAEVNVRGTYVVSRAFLPHLKDLDEGWILSNSPPVKIDRAPGQAPYAWSKMGMTFITLSLDGELTGHDIGCNSIWPVTAIDTRATRYFGLGTEEDWRTPEITSDAFLEVLNRDPAECSGNSFYDEGVLRGAGVEDFSQYKS
jgi:Dehydrogenases with different specificities (related to short-chain alcohol dehydrogenases)